MATSKTQIAVGDLLDREFPEFRIRENHRPDWMMSSCGQRLELDFFIEELGIAFEVQGAQHYQYVPFFHKTYEQYEQRKKADEEKEFICRANAVKLIKIYTMTDAIVAIANIKERLGLYQQAAIQAEKEAERAAAKSRKKPGSRHSIKLSLEDWRVERLERTRRKMEQYKNGQIEVTPEKYEMWLYVLSHDGDNPPGSIIQS